MPPLDPVREAVVEVLWTEHRLPFDRCEDLADRILDSLRAVGALREPASTR